MITRTVSGIIGAILVIVALFFNQPFPLLLNILVALVSFLSMYEIFVATGVSKIRILIIPSLLFSSLVPLFRNEETFQIAWYLYTIAIFCILIFCKNTVSFKEVSCVYTMSFVITFCLSMLITLRDYAEIYGTFFVVLVLAIAWMTDTGAYFCGSFFGKHKLCPSISPQKTVEGAVAGILVSLCSIVLICFVFQTWFFSSEVSINYASLLIMGTIASVLSILGDLSFSIVKRSYHIKDFGNVIPGHGGILDRMDSVMFVGPFVYFFIHFFPIILR